MSSSCSLGWPCPATRDDKSMEIKKTNKRHKQLGHDQKHGYIWLFPTEVFTGIKNTGIKNKPQNIKGIHGIEGNPTHDN